MPGTYISTNFSIPDCRKQLIATPSASRLKVWGTYSRNTYMIITESEQNLKAR